MKSKRILTKRHKPEVVKKSGWDKFEEYMMGEGMKRYEEEMNKIKS